MFSLLERGRVVEDTAVSCVRNSEDQARCFADARRQERQVAGSSDWRRRYVVCSGVCTSIVPMQVKKKGLLAGWWFVGLLKME